ncbi:MAG: helix-turn-helix domain-containing protein [Solirubrobacterales bacterium]
MENEQQSLIDLLKPAEVAARLSVSRTWLYDAARDGRIPSVRIGGRDGPLRFVPEDLAQWLAEARAQWTPGQRRGGVVPVAETTSTGSHAGPVEVPNVQA